MSNPIKIDNKTSRKKSRTKKALSTALLMYFALSEGMTIQFSKTRKSYYALKVLRGNSIVDNDIKYDMDSFMEISHKFMLMMESMIKSNKITQFMNYIVNKETITPIDISVNEIDQKQLTNINENDSRNKEAAFSNTLAWLLIQKNYQLHYRTYNKKQSVRVVNFYVWDGITTPDGIYHQLETFQYYSGLIDYIGSQLNLQNTLTVDKSILNDIINLSKSSSSTFQLQYMNSHNDNKYNIQQFQINKQIEELTQGKKIESCFIPVIDYSSYQFIGPGPLDYYQ